ncbi:MAG: DUF4062 domain-containing protein [Tannerella sp.]|jgi:WD40 repeat protein|nr:DUF4062 domain-containing protein [Tannerella sp.]
MENTGIKWEKATIFISSTFNDMHAERDYLVKRVFPQLSAWCEKHRLRLIDIDLRWGVSEADATQNRRVVQICLDRIDECRPFFICFLGQRRGWVPTSEDVNEETIQRFPKLTETAGEKEEPCLGHNSVTEMEIRHARIDPLHNGTFFDKAGDKQDGSQVEHAFFFLREPDYLENLPHPDLGNTYTNKADPYPETADIELNRWRNQIIPATGRPVVHYTADWDLNESTHEIALPLAVPTTAACNSDLWKKAFKSWKERWKQAGVTVGDNGEITDPGELKKAKTYNKQFTGGRLSNFQGKRLNSQNIDEEIDKIIIRQLQDAIKKRFGERIVEELTPLQKELDQQEQFMHIVNDGFIRRAGDFKVLDEYVDSPAEHRPLAIVALAGVGKTSLLANWIDYRQKNGGNDIYYRFIGNSDDSVSAERLVRSLLEQIKADRKMEVAIPANPSDMLNKLPDFLSELGKKSRAIIVIDALNQFETGMDNLYWIPMKLPENVKLIVSFKHGDHSAGDSYYAELDRTGAMLLHEVKPFENIDDRKSLVRAYLDQYFKELDESQLDDLVKAEGAENPLFLKIILSELRVFGAYSELSEIIRTHFGTDPVSAFDSILNRMEQDPAYSKLQQEITVSHIFGWLAHSRYGLSTDELADLSVREKLADKREDALDAIFVIIRQLRPFLAKRDGRIDFFYESFKTAAKLRYTSGHPHARPTAGWHKSLAEYFETLPYFTGNDRKFPNVRKAEELAWQWRSSDEQSFIRTVSVFDWMDAVQRTFGIDFMLKEMENMPDLTPDWLLSVRKALVASSSVIRSDSIGSSQLYGDRNADFKDMVGGTRRNDLDLLKIFARSIGTLNVREMGKNHLVEQLFLRLGNDRRKGLSAFFADAASSKRLPWLRSVYARRTSLLDDALVMSFRIEGVPLLLRVTEDGRFAVVCEFKSVKVYNLSSNRIVRTFDILSGYLPAEAYLSEDAKLAAASVVDFSGHFGVYVWEVASGKVLFKRIDEKKEWLWQVANLNKQNCVEFYATKKGLEDPFLLAFHPEEKNLFCMDRSAYTGCPDLKYLATAGVDFTTRHDARETWPYKRFILFNGCSFGFQTARQVSHGGCTVTVDSTEKIVKLKKYGSSREMDLGRHEKTLTNVALSADAKVAASCSHDRTVVLYDVDTGKIKGRMHGFSGNPVCVALDGTGGRAYVSVNDGTIQVYDTKKISLQNSTNFAPHVGSVLLGGVGYTSSGNIVSCGEDGYIKKWNVRTGECFFTSEKIIPHPEAFAVSSDGLLMAYCSGEDCVVLDAENHRLLSKTQIGAMEASMMAITDKAVFIITRNGYLIRVFYRNRFFWQSKYRRDLIGDNTVQSSILFADDSRVIALSNTSKGKSKLHQYNLSGKESAKAIDMKTVYNSGVRLRNGTMIFSTVGELTILSSTGTVTGRIATPPMSDHLIMACSPHRNLIAAVSTDGILRVWNLNANKGEELLAVFGGGMLFTSILFSPDGRQIIAGDQSGLLTWFDLVIPET